MSLEPGISLGHYEILSTLGAGGMGEVYLARDTRLGREVAVKVLPEGFAEDTERLARFEREARLLASLNHSNIATLYGFEKQGSTRFLVMELVEGETLGQRVERGPLPLGEALDLFVQIAEGLEAAHEKGIIHRDLKPSNIKLTAERTAKILDFGLAKAMASEESLDGTDLSESPTLTQQATRRGELLGTAAYMSPEQARGRTIDRRTDIWAFGCCLFEVLARRRAFAAETITDTLARVLEREPDWEELPASTPRKVQELLRRCLHKDPRQPAKSGLDPPAPGNRAYPGRRPHPQQPRHDPARAGTAGGGGGDAAASPRDPAGGARGAARRHRPYPQQPGRRPAAAGRSRCR